MAHAANRTAIGTVVRSVIAAIEPWYDWGKIGVERIEPLRSGRTATDGEVRFSNCNGSASTFPSRSDARRREPDDKATQLNQGAARSVPTFDPAAWLGALVSIGGSFALASGRKLWLVVARAFSPAELQE